MNCENKTRDSASLESKRLPGFVPLALFVGVLSISFAAIFFRKAQPTDPLVSAGIRLAVAALVLSPFFIRSIKNKKVNARLLKHAVLAGLAYGLHFGSWVTSLMLTSVAASVTLVTTTPLLLALVAVITGKDRPGKRWWFSLGLAFVGLLLIGGGDVLDSQTLKGDALALFGACAMASYLIIARRLGRELDVWAFSFVACAVGASLLLGSACALGVPIAPASGEALIYIVLAALLPQLVGHNLLTWSMKHTTPAIAGIAILGEPVGAAILGWLWLGETVSGLVIVGCALTLFAVGLAVLNMRSRQIAAHT